MQWSTIAEYGVTYGLVLSIVFTAAVFAGAAVSKDFLLDDYPAAIQQRYGRPQSARGRQVAVFFVVFVWGVCGIPLMVMAMIGLHNSLKGGLGFLSAALCAALVFATLSVWDLIVLDWFVLAGLRPDC